MTALPLVITDAGRAALVNAQHNGTNAVQIAAAGVSATQIAATAATAALPGEVKRIATLSGTQVAADVVHLIVRDETADAYTMRSLALYLADGTLFAAYGQADPILQKTAGAIMLLAVDVTLADIAAAQITFGNTDFLDPPASADRAGVVELATLAEAQAGDPLRVVTAATAKAALLSWLGFTPLEQGGTGNKVAIGWDGISRLYAQVDQTLLGALVFEAAIADVWRVSNDGSGSGLDADLLDGQQGSWYADIAGRLGYQPFATSGVRSMTGNITFDAGNDRRVVWPTPGVHFYGNPGAFGFYDDTNGRTVWGYAQGVNTVSYNTNLDVSGYMKRGGCGVWDSGTDGSGSGLDADLLDGQDGSWYTDVNARLGYQAFATNGAKPMNGNITFDGANDRRLIWATPGIHFYGNPGAFGLYDEANGRTVWGYAQGANTFSFNTNLDVTGYLKRAGNTVWDAGTDGAGSGADADLLDGQEGSYYTDVAGRLGFTPVRQGGGAGQANNAIRIGWNGTDRLKAQVDAVDLGAVVFEAGGGDAVWRASNDGAGSGLDADMLDGRHASDFALASQLAGSIGENGYQELPSGLVIQWGDGQHADSSGEQHVVFPRRFPNLCFQTIVSNAAGGAPSAFHGSGNQSQDGFDVFSSTTSLQPALAGTSFRWLAVGN